MSLLTTLRNAIIAIAEGDSTLRTLTSQTSGFVVQWGDLKNAQLPAIALLLFENSPTGGTGGRRQVNAQLTAVADGNGAQTTAESITARLAAVLTAAAFIAQGIDAFVSDDVERQDDAQAAALTARGRADLDLTFLAHTAAI